MTVIELVLAFALSSDPSGVYQDGAKQYGIVVRRAGDHWSVEWWSGKDDEQKVSYLGTLERTGEWTYTERWHPVPSVSATCMGQWRFDWGERRRRCYGYTLERVP